MKKGLRKRGLLFQAAIAGILVKNYISIAYLVKTGSSALPVIVHVLNLPLDEAVNALAVRPVCETADHAEPVRPLLSGKQLLDRDHDPLSSLLLVVATHHLLFQTNLRLGNRAIFCLPPASLQRPGSKDEKSRGTTELLGQMENFSITTSYQKIEDRRKCYKPTT